MLHHEPKDDKPCEFQVRVGDCFLWVCYRHHVGCDVGWSLDAEHCGRSFRQFSKDYATYAMA
jgi:hypothetical protein